jgi:hypothetical protein
MRMWICRDQQHATLVYKKSYCTFLLVFVNRAACMTIEIVPNSAHSVITIYQKVHGSIYQMR